MTETTEMTAAPVAVPDRVSPLDFGDIDCVCRTAKTIASATCSGCGEAIYSGVHLPNVAYGFWHAHCCPCSSFSPTPDEAKAMARRRGRIPSDEERKPKKVVIPRLKPIVEPARRQTVIAAEERAPNEAPWEKERPAPGGRKSKYWMPRVFVMKLRQFEGERRIVYDMIVDRMPVEDLYKRCAEQGIEGRAILIGLVKTGAVAVHWAIAIPA